MNSRSDKKKNLANEPETAYLKTSENNMDLKIFSSFKEMEDDNYKWLASLTAEQHLQNATALIKRIFAEDLKKNPKIERELIID